MMAPFVMMLTTPAGPETAAKPAAITMSKSHFDKLLYHRIASKIYLESFQEDFEANGLAILPAQRGLPPHAAHRED